MSSKDLTLIFDGLCLLIFLANIYLGYKNGLIKTVIKLVSGFVAIFLAITFAPVFAKAINLATFLPKEYLLIAPFINRIIWYAVVFLASLIILKVIALVTEIINKTPIIGTFNKLLGMIVSFVYSFVIVSIISIVVSLPVFSFKEAYEASFLKPINTVAVYTLNAVADSNLEFDSYTDSYKEKLYEWLITNDMINTEYINDNTNNIFDITNKKAGENE